MQNMSRLPQKCIWNTKNKKKYSLVCMVRFKAHICRSCGQLTSVPYSYFTEHLALCGTECKTKPDKCSPRTVDHWCPYLGFKFCWEIRMCHFQVCFCWSKKLKLWVMYVIQNLMYSGRSSNIVNLADAPGTTRRHVDICCAQTQLSKRNGKWPTSEAKAQIKTFSYTNTALVNL